jgi:diguanylate cyclase (GGDEF)-like protein/PAS domain S-box-containing protein
LIGLEAFLLLFNYWREIDHHLQRLDATRQTAVVSALNSYQRIIEVFYEERFNLAPTTKLLIKAASSTETEQAQLRKHLYRRFISSYHNLQRKGILSLQFILPDGVSFLRFDHPDLYGDQILSQRPMLNSVLQGFPQGGMLEYDPVYPSYHFAFPIMKEDMVVGIVDFGVSFEAIRNTLHELAGLDNTHYRFMLRRNRFESLSLPSTKVQFRPSVIDSNFLVAPPTDSHDQTATLNSIESYLLTHATLKQALEREESYSTEICLRIDDCHAISLQAVHDNNQELSGYILSYTAMERFRYLRSYHLTAFLLGAVLISLALYAFHRWLLIIQRLRTISDHMAEGMYVTDINDKLLYVNPTACKILKYSKSQLLGKNVHKHLHCAVQCDDIQPSHTCEIRNHYLRGEHYKSDDEHFKCQDGTKIRVSIVCSPVWTNGNISGSVVLFRDITQEYEIKRRQQRSDVAFSTLAEGVMITDAKGNIEAVNRAFSEITGYREQEVLGRNPSILKSGQHNKGFYQAMWDKLILEGRWQGEIWNRRKSGEIYPEFLRITRVMGEDGNVAEYVATFSDATEKRQHEMQLQKLAYTDPLTNLHNRAAFIEMFGHALAKAKRRYNRCALLYLDLDRFKTINDTLGHDIGDKVLIESAERLNQAVRNEDEVARLGGDEFIVLLEDIRQDDAPARVARKIISLLGQPINVEPHVLHVTASVGIAVYPHDGQDSTTLLKNADTAMYMAKREGRNGFYYFTQAMAQKEENRFKLEIDLHTALLNDEFLLRYQPRVNLHSGETTGFEASLYWQHPQRGLLSASEFLGIAHDTGVMRDITHWIINEACAQMLAWLDAGLEPGRMAINIDNHTFNSNDVYDQICRTVGLTGVSPHRIELVITENGLLAKSLEDPFWGQLVDLGFNLSINDFGTGVTSLYRLKHSPVNCLKIAQSYIRELEHDEDDRSIIRTVITMGKSLGLKILAEGVENHRQLHFLSELGCDEGQGYLFSEPQPAIAITQLLSTNHYKALVAGNTHH